MSDTGHQPSSPLQFDTVESESAAHASCAFCTVPLGDTYFEINGKLACPNCQTKVAQAVAQQGGPVLFVRALAFGIAAAAAGAVVWYLIRAVTHLEIGLIAIVVGLMVGRAVRVGAGNRGGLVYQLLAVVLTYLAIVSANLPDVWAAVRGSISTSIAARMAGGTSQGGAAPDPESAEVQALVDDAMSHLPLAAWGLIGWYVLESPFLGGVSNVIGWLIMFFGLQQAWRLTRATPLQIAGPFSLAARGAA